MSKSMKKIALVVLVVLLVASLSLALLACKPKPEPDNPDNPVPPTPMELYTELSNALLDSLDANLEKGFSIDWSGDLGYAFDEESKQNYNWNYTFAIKGNLFADGNNDLSIEIKESKEGGATLLGLYNDSTARELLVKSYDQKFKFSEASIGGAIRAVAVANGLDAKSLGSIEIMNGTPLKQLLVGVLPTLLAQLGGSEDGDIVKTDNSYNFTITQEKLSGLLNSVLPLIGGSLPQEVADAIDTLLNMIPESFLLDLTFNVAGGKVSSIDAMAIIEEGSEAGEFNMSFTTNDIFKDIIKDNTAVSDKIRDEFADVKASKLLSFDTQGVLAAVDKNGATQTTFKWRASAGIDLGLLLENNLIFDNLPSDNFLYVQLLRNDVPLIDIGFDPDGFGTYHLKAAVDVRAIVGMIPSLGIDSSILSFAGIPDNYWMLDVDVNAVPQLIQFFTAAPQTLASVAEAELDLGGILGSLPADVAPILEGIIGKDITKLTVYSSSFEYGLPAEDFDVDVYEQFVSMPGKNGIGRVSRPYGNNGKQVFLNAAIETSKATIDAKTVDMLKVYDSDGNVLLDANTPVTYDELMSYVNLHVGYDLGNTYYLDGTKMTSQLAASNMPQIKAITGIDKTKIGVIQEATVYTGMLDNFGVLQTLRRMNDTIKGIAGIDIASIFNTDMPLNSFKVNVMLSDTAKTADGKADLTMDVKNPTVDGEAFDANKSYRTGANFKFDSVSATVKYVNTTDAPIQYAADKLTKTVTYSFADIIGANSKMADDAIKVSSNIVRQNEAISERYEIANTKDVNYKLSAFGGMATKELLIKIETPVKTNIAWTGPSAYVLGYDISGDTTFVAANLSSKFEYTFTYKDNSTKSVIAPNGSVSWTNKDYLTERTSKLKRLGDMEFVATLTDTNEKFYVYVPVIEDAPTYETGITDISVSDDKTSVSGKIKILGTVDNMFGKGKDMFVGLTVTESGKSVDVSYTVNGKANGIVMDLPNYSKVKEINFNITGLDAAKNYVITPVIKNSITGESKIKVMSSAYTGQASITSKTLGINDGAAIAYGKSLNGIVSLYQLSSVMGIDAIDEYVLTWVKEDKAYKFVNHGGDSLFFVPTFKYEKNGTMTDITLNNSGSVNAIFFDSKVEIKAGQMTATFNNVSTSPIKYDPSKVTVDLNGKTISVDFNMPKADFENAVKNSSDLAGFMAALSFTDTGWELVSATVAGNAVSELPLGAEALSSWTYYGAYYIGALQVKLNGVTYSMSIQITL